VGSIGQQAGGVGEGDGDRFITLTLGLGICSGAWRDGPALGCPRALADGGRFFHGLGV
jgi:hypothetical protein